MGETEISWTHRSGTVGRTWNPTQGCSRASTGCEHCYAERMAARFANDGWSHGLINLKTRKWNGEVRLAEHKLSDPLRWRAPSTVFVNSMSDLFHEGLTNEQIAAVFGVMAAAPQHTFQCLTKRAKRMREWFAWVRKESLHRGDWTIPQWRIVEEEAMELVPDLPATASGRAWPLSNVWIGVSVENQAAADERIPELLATPAAVRFLSCEPLIGPVNLHEYLLGFPSGHPAACACGHGHGFTRCPNYGGVSADCHHSGCACAGFAKKSGGDGLSWVIVGCESGPGARPCEVEWLRSLRDQCAAAGVAYFLKQAHETDMGTCGDLDNPNGDAPCGERIRYFVHGPKGSSVSCACTVEGAEDANGCPPVGFGDGSKRKSGGVIELPYLDGFQHAEFPR